MANSRNKGNAFEKDVCLLLSSWMLGKTVKKQRDCVFRRQTTTVMPASGHWEGAGDLLHAPDVRWPFCAELKKQEGWNFDGAWRSPFTWTVSAWWQQARDQSDIAGKFPLLIFSGNNRPIYCMLRCDVWKRLEGNAGTRLSFVPERYAPPVCVVTLADFLDLNVERVQVLAHLLNLKSATG